MIIKFIYILGVQFFLTKIRSFTYMYMLHVYTYYVMENGLLVFDLTNN